MSDGLATWVIVDIRRRGQLRRHFAAGPDDPESSGLAHAVATGDPGPGTAPDQVYESGQTLLLTHVDDELALGLSPDGQPFLTMLGATSLVSVPVADGSHRYGALTLLRDAGAGQFALGDAALAEEVGALLGRAISGRRVLRQRTEAADALRASLLPPVLKPIPGVEIATAHLAATRGPEVGGDFYDAYPTPGGWGVAIGDVCGKGEDAAAATATARHAIRVIGHWNGDPADVLRRANDIMLAEEFGGRFVTASALHLSWRDTRCMWYWPPPAIRAPFSSGPTAMCRCCRAAVCHSAFSLIRRRRRWNWIWPTAMCCSSSPTDWPTLAARRRPTSRTGSATAWLSSLPAAPPMSCRTCARWCWNSAMASWSMTSPCWRCGRAPRRYGEPRLMAWPP